MRATLIVTLVLHILSGVFWAGTTFAFQPDYSPTGRKIVFSENRPDGCHLITFDAKGHHRHELPIGDGCYFNSSWEVGRLGGHT